MASISWAFVMTTRSGDSTGKTSFNRKTHDSLLVSFGRWSSRHSGRPRTQAIRRRPQIRPSFARIVQACGDLVAREIGEFPR